MEKVKRKIGSSLWLFCCLVFIITIVIPTSAQTQQSALLAIQQADEKLSDTISYLEEVSELEIEIRDLVIITEDARQLIAIAKLSYNEANYTVAYDNANQADNYLDGVIEELEARTGKNRQNTTVLFSLLGVFSAIFLGLFIFFIVKRGYPWYLAKRDEEYGKLEIQYNTETEGETNE